MDARLKLKVKHGQKSSRLQFDLEKLKDPAVADVFQAQVRGRFAALVLLNNFNELATSINSILMETAQKVLGKRRKNMKAWVTNEV